VIARLQRAMLAAQLLLAAGLAAWLTHADLLPLWAAIAVGALAPIAVHASVLTLDFALAWAGRGVRPADAAPGGLGPWVVAWAREIVDSVRSFSVAQPLLGARPLPPGPDEPARLPVLLIHGYFCNRAVWRGMARRLAAHGHPIGAVDLEPLSAPIDEHTSQIAAAVDALRARTGAQRIALVCHSMGGLAARAYLRAHGDAAVACVVTLGSPHRGTLHAAFGRGANIRQMRRDSPWLRELASAEPAERRRRFTVILSWQDNIVAPHAIQTLDGARTVAFGGLGHVSLVYDRRVAEAVLDALDTDAPEAGGTGASVALTRPQSPVARLSQPMPGSSAPVRPR
jgi:triacylglycerol esterase/lipase EstA (alpha/beta hydrolase family)